MGAHLQGVLNMGLVIMALLGAVVGGVVLDEFGGVVVGLFVGGLMGSVSTLARKVRALERRLDARKTGDAPAADETHMPTREARTTAAVRPRAAAPPSPPPVQEPAATP